MIDWTPKSTNELQGKFKDKPDTTVFLAKREKKGSVLVWRLWGAFVPDSQEPVEYQDVTELQAGALTFWIEFERAMCPRILPKR